jgi:nucleotide-binding universal stress UspA family protein
MRDNPETFETQEEEMMAKTILIATDGSSHANKAVQVGSDIAAKYGAEVVLVHVLLRDHLSENLRQMAEVEYQVAERCTDPGACAPSSRRAGSGGR